MKFSKKFLVGLKLGMTQIIDESGAVTPVTVVKVLENEVVGFRTKDKDGYDSVRVAYHQTTKKSVSKPLAGQFKGESVYQKIKEFRVSSIDGYELNKRLDSSELTVSACYDVQSKTIGRGFTGAIKAWNHQRGPMSHGSKNHRLLGSIGQATTPGNVKKGKRMHVRYGNENRVVKNLQLVSTDNEFLFFKGAIAGKSNVVFITGDQ
jgi:large subunit ribosomal protein L3